MENLIAWILMAAVSLPISFLAARGCLRGVLRLMMLGDRPGGLSYASGGMRRDGDRPGGLSHDVL
jgi:hypothetical protein